MTKKKKKTKTVEGRRVLFDYMRRLALAKTVIVSLPDYEHREYKTVITDQFNVLASVRKETKNV